jgi:SAM-dependent methyltransferase
MRVDEFSKMRALEDTNWWFRGRRYLLRNLIQGLKLRDALILDAGCGTGFARSELSRGGTVIGLDASPEAIAQGLDGKPVESCVAYAQSIPFPSDTFDLVVALDIIEHLEDEMPALSEVRRACKSGAYFYVTVPAYQGLWSHHDEVLGHYRRYTVCEMVEKLKKAGFEICRASYLVSSILPAAAAFRALRRRFGKESKGTDLFPVPEPFNFLLSLVMRVECRLAWNARLPFGLTACVLARKPEEP